MAHSYTHFFQSSTEVLPDVQHPNVRLQVLISPFVLSYGSNKGSILSSEVLSYNYYFRTSFRTTLYFRPEVSRYRVVTVDTSFRTCTAVHVQYSTCTCTCTAVLSYFRTLFVIRSTQLYSTCTCTCKLLLACRVCRKTSQGLRISPADRAARPRASSRDHGARDPRRGVREARRPTADAEGRARGDRRARGRGVHVADATAGG